VKELSDNELAWRAGGGDRNAFDLLLRRHYDGIYRLAYRWCQSRTDAQDIAQEVCLKLAAKIGGFDGRSGFATWLYRIVINTAKDFSRRCGTRQSHEAAFAQSRAKEGSNPGPAGNDDPHETLQRAVDRLSEKQKNAVLLVLGQGLSHREAARVLGCFEATVSWRIHQARKKLGRLLSN